MMAVSKDLIAVVGDGHAVFSSRARQLMGRASLIHKAHLNGNIRVALVVEPVDPTLPEEGESGHGKGDGVRDAGLAAPVPAGDNSGIAKGQLRGALVGFEAGNGHTDDLKLFDFFNRLLLSSFQFDILTLPAARQGRPHRSPAHRKSRCPACGS